MLGTAPVYSIADEQRARAEAAAWSQFAAAQSDGEFCAAWLALLAARVERARGALVLVSEGEGRPFAVAAVWPDPRRDLQYLGPVAQRALGERAGIVQSPSGGEPGPDGAAHVGYPIEVDGRLCAAVVLDLGPGPQGALQGALTSLMSLTAIVGPLLMNNLFFYFSKPTAPVFFPGAHFLLGGLLMVISIWITYRVFKRQTPNKDIMPEAENAEDAPLLMGH